MAQLAKGDIKVGSSRIVGRVRVDPGAIRSEAGPIEPRLIIPATIEMNNRPLDQMLALTRLTAYLHLHDANNPTTQVGSPAQVDLLPGMYARSLPEGHNEHNIDLRFQLSLASVQRLESMRHETPDEQFTLHLRMNGSVVWIRETFGEMHVPGGRAGPAAPEDPFKLQFGLHSALTHFWTSDIDSMRVQIDPSVWIDNVLPGFGIDGIRLLELAFHRPCPRWAMQPKPSMKPFTHSTPSTTRTALASAEPLSRRGTHSSAQLTKSILLTWSLGPRAGHRTIHARTLSTRFGPRSSTVAMRRITPSHSLPVTNQAPTTRACSSC